MLISLLEMLHADVCNLISIGNGRGDTEKEGE